MHLRTQLRNFWYGGAPQHPVARSFAMLLAGALGLSILGLWISAASVYIDPKLFRWAALCGLAFPIFLLGSVGLWLLCLLFAARRTWIMGLFGILLCAQPIFTYFPFHPFVDNDSITADPDQIRVVSYNTLFFGREMDQQDELMRYLINTRANIICFQEGEVIPQNIEKIKKRFAETSTPYVEYNADHDEAVGIISAYPILEQKVLSYFPGNAVVAYRLQHPRGEILVVNCHFRSNLLSGSTLKGYTNMMHGKSEQEEGSAWQNTKQLVSKISHSAQDRATMVADVEQYLQEHSHLPIILCGDFNDSPISFTRYRIASFGLTDAFRTAGHGAGFTYRRNAIRVRIDHIFCSRDFQPIQAKIDATAPYSDHQPISATLLWRKAQP